ncbi:MAG: serine hydrolase [Bacteroidota bacterium]|nr:serine hydrolase [Bacteroidota bacterium]
MAKLKVFFLLLFSGALIFSCKKTNTLPQSVVATDTLYFPPVGSIEWQTTTPSSLGWNTNELNNLYTYLDSEHTKAFIILKGGKLVVEKYFGTFTADSLWYWASAGKTLTAFLTGIAQQDGIINLNDKTSKYLGTGWTSEPLDKENLITIKNQLTMTTGLDDGIADPDCTLPACLVYKSDAGTRWAYHNAAYTLLDEVIQNASGLSYNAYFQQKIRNRIGMNGLWIKSPNSNNVFYSNARSMARFGLLMLNKGKWDKTAILSDTNYFNAQVNTSQNLNLSYGYLTWLNGKTSFMVPTLQNVFPGPLIPNAPADMYAALGKNDQKIYVVPSQKLVVIRMGDSAGGFQLSVSDFDNKLWSKLKTIIQ